MRPLRVALIHRWRARSSTERVSGLWEFDTPEFTITHLPTAKGRVHDRSVLSQSFDLAVYEAPELMLFLPGDKKFPVCYWEIDSDNSEGYYKHRLAEGKKCDIILMEAVPLDWFTELGKPVFRFNSCPSSKILKDYGLPKDIDVSFFVQTKDPTRATLDIELAKFCKERGYSYESGERNYYNYGQSLNRSKISINWSGRAPYRPWRFFESMACRACLVTNPLLEVSEEIHRPGIDYVECQNMDELWKVIPDLLESGKWKEYAEAGYKYIQENHTWPIRSQQLREKLATLAGRWPQFGMAP